MKLVEKLEYWTKKYFTVSVVGFIIFSVIIHLYSTGYKCLSIVLVFFATGAAFLYRRTKDHNDVHHTKAVVIIGCDTGLGYSLALYCRSLGFDVIASVLKKEGPNTEELFAADVHIYELDITIEESIRNFKISVQEYLKTKEISLYALVNNAGLMVIGDFEWQTEEQMMQQVNVNVLGTMRITKSMLPLLRADKGRIVFISSHCTLEPLPSFSIYGATKSCIRAWATALRVELENQGINIVCFAPGSFFLQSNIMSRQMEYFKDMEDSMSTEVWKFHSDSFKKIELYFKNVAAFVRSQKVTNSILYAVFRDALLDKQPSVFYECCSWRYTYYHTLCHISPTIIRDILIKRFLQFPR